MFEFEHTNDQWRFWEGLFKILARRNKIMILKCPSHSLESMYKFKVGKVKHMAPSTWWYCKKGLEMGADPFWITWATSGSYNESYSCLDLYLISSKLEPYCRNWRVRAGIMKPMNKISKAWVPPMVGLTMELFAAVIPSYITQFDFNFGEVTLCFLFRNLRFEISRHDGEGIGCLRHSRVVHPTTLDLEAGLQNSDKLLILGMAKWHTQQTKSWNLA